MKKPFIRVMGKVYGENQLFVQVYLPRQQLRNFTDALSKLIRTGFLDTYEYFIQDLTKTERETIPYQLFKDNHWVYEHKVYLEKLRSMQFDSQWWLLGFLLFADFDILLIESRIECAATTEIMSLGDGNLC